MTITRARNLALVLVATLLLWGLSGCDRSEAGVLVNVQLETADLQVSEVRLRGYAPTQESLVLEVTRALPDNGLFGQTENIYIEVPRSWIGKIVWLQAEGRHEGNVTAHGSVSVLPRKNTVVEATLVLVAGDSPCGNGVIDPGEQCDGTELGDHSCLSITGLAHGVPRCVGCRLDLAPCHDCGNGVIEAGPESCDGENLGGETCQSQGFVTGELGCSDDCRLDRTACRQGCGNDVVEPGEACDGTDPGRTSCAEQEYLWGHIGCTVDCTPDYSGCVGICGDDRLDALEDCDGTDFGAQTCLTAAGREAGGLLCTDACHLDLSECHTCGDGIIEADEVCDGPSLRGLTCQDYLFDGGTLACDGVCNIDTSGCTLVTCGNGTIDAGEQCDGTNLASEDCVGLGFGGGPLTCDGFCNFDTTACTPLSTGCGNGYVGAGEGCDDGNLTSGDGCDAGCQVEPGYRCYDDPSTCVVDGSVLFVDCQVTCPGTGTGTLADPYCSIQAAVDNAVSGQLVWLLPSTCVEEVTVHATHADINLSGDATALWTAASCPALDIDRQVLVYGIRLEEGIMVRAGGALTLRHSEIGPGLLGCYGVNCFFDALCTIDRNLIYGHADGGIFTNGGSFRIENNIIVENGTGGGGGSTVGGIRVAEPTAPPAVVVNNTIAHNIARSNQAAGVKCFAPVDVRNNIIWMNLPEDLGPNCDPWYNDIGIPDLSGTQGNISLPPQFVNQPAGDYHILPTSPCVDTADPTGIPPAPFADVDGQSRYFGLGVDMGADEAS